MGMLVLSRRIDEGITITVPPSQHSQTISVKVIEIRGYKVRIGFEAEKSVIIHRDEIQRVVDVEWPIDEPSPPPVVPVIRIGDKLPGA